MPDELAAFARERGAEVLGFLPVVEDELARRRLSIAPLRFGAGLKGKVGESLAAGVPVVGTSVAAEGFADHGAGMLVADDAPALASAIARLATDDLLWQRLSDGGRALIDEVCGPARCDRELSDVLEFLEPRQARSVIWSLALVGPPREPELVEHRPAPHGELLSRAVLRRSRLEGRRRSRAPTPPSKRSSASGEPSWRACSACASPSGRCRRGSDRGAGPRARSPQHDSDHDPTAPELVRPAERIVAPDAEVRDERPGLCSARGQQLGRVVPRVPAARERGDVCRLHDGHRHGKHRGMYVAGAASGPACSTSPR